MLEFSSWRLRHSSDNIMMPYSTLVVKNVFPIHTTRLTGIVDWHSCPRFHTLRPSDATWRYRSGSRLAPPVTKPLSQHDDVIKWKHFPRYWPFVREIHWSPVNSPHKGQWRGALLFSLIRAMNKRLSKQSRGWWFETPSRSVWHLCNEAMLI